jgi:hypothetical protein
MMQLTANRGLEANRGATSLTRAIKVVAGTTSLIIPSRKASAAAQGSSSKKR